jgi:hypothetical protein
LVIGHFEQSKGHSEEKRSVDGDQVNLNNVSDFAAYGQKWEKGATPPNLPSVPGQLIVMTVQMGIRAA